jgi:hypothetical protein
MERPDDREGSGEPLGRAVKVTPTAVGVAQREADNAPVAVAPTAGEPVRVGGGVCEGEPEGEFEIEMVREVEGGGVAVRDERGERVSKGEGDGVP